MFELMNCHALEGLRALEPESVDCIVTSPPYWGLRGRECLTQAVVLNLDHRYSAKIKRVFFDGSQVRCK